MNYNINTDSKIEKNRYFGNPNYFWVYLATQTTKSEHILTGYVMYQHIALANMLSRDLRWFDDPTAMLKYLPLQLLMMLGHQIIMLDHVS